MTTPVQKLYEVWAGDSEFREALGQSLEPRGTDWLFEVFAGLGPRAGDRVLDAGARDAVHAIRLVREHGVGAVALDPLPLHSAVARERVADAGLTDEIDVVEGALEELPFDDASFDWIWCRDVLVHVDAGRGLAECARVLRPHGVLLAYVTLATDRLEPEETDELVRGLALRRSSLDGAHLEAAAGAAGFLLRSIERLGSEWRERMLEGDQWDVRQDLLRLARLRRREAELVERYGEDAVAAAAGGLTWGVYQLLGKLCPTVYVWERRA
ncbi:MAG: class I SAM-dependent methyltransferase [Gaiellaceae bacterium]